MCPRIQRTNTEQETNEPRAASFARFTAGAQLGSTAAGLYADDNADQDHDAPCWGGGPGAPCAGRSGGAGRDELVASGRASTPPLGLLHLLPQIHSGLLRSPPRDQLQQQLSCQQCVTADKRSSSRLTVSTRPWMDTYDYKAADWLLGRRRRANAKRSRQHHSRGGGTTGTQAIFD